MTEKEELENLQVLEELKEKLKKLPNSSLNPKREFKETTDMEERIECGDRVLVRNSEDDKWVFGRYIGFTNGFYHCSGLFVQEPIKCAHKITNGATGYVSFLFKYCIPYEGNEFLEGKVKTDKIYFAEVGWFNKYKDEEAYWHNEESDLFIQLETLCLSRHRDVNAIIKLTTENMNKEWYLNPRPRMYVNSSLPTYDRNDDFIPLDDTYILNRNVYAGHILIMGLSQQELDVLNEKRIQNGLSKFECFI